LFLGEVLNPLQSMGVGLTLVSIYLINQRDTLTEKLRKVRWLVSEVEPSQDKASAEGEATGLLESSELNAVELPVQVRVGELESEV